MIDHKKLNEDIINKCSKEQLEKIKQQLLEKIEMKEEEASLFDSMQYAAKIKINSAFGSVSSPYFPLFDLDSAEAITLTGQVIIKNSGAYVNSFMKENYQKDLHEDYNLCVSGDTDSGDKYTKIRFSKSKIKINGIIYECDTLINIIRNDENMYIRAKHIQIGDEII